jgi:hypothetical protein
MAEVTSFGEKFQVSTFCVLFSFFDLVFPFFSLTYLFFSSSKAFFCSGEVEKKLVFEVDRLKAELASKQVELEVERQGRQVTKEALRAHVGESEQRKDDALAALKEALERSDCFKKDSEGTRVLFCFFPSSFLLFSLYFWFSNLYPLSYQFFGKMTRSSRMTLKL